MCLLSQGRIFYYENGYAHLKMLLSKRPKKIVSIPGTNTLSENNRTNEFPWGNVAYFSTSINTQLIELPSSGNLRAKRTIKNYMDDFPEFEGFLSCANKFMKVNFRNCVEEFNNVSLPNRRAR